MAEPNEIIVGPAEIYVAPVGTAFPQVTVDPASFDPDWRLVGEAGSRNYTEDGVRIRTNITTNQIRALGTIAPRKMVRSEMSFEVEFNVMDLQPSALALAYGTDPTTVGSLNGGTGFAIDTSPVPLELAVLIRVQGQSPLEDGGNCQWQLYDAIQGGNGEGTFSKTDAFGPGHLWQAFENSDGKFVEFVAEGVEGS